MSPWLNVSRRLVRHGSDAVEPTTVIDVKMHGVAAITASYLVRGSATALIDTGPGSSFKAVRGALDQLGVESLDWIILTHAHLDHAGAAGQLATEFPEARIAVHPRAARHIADPTRLWKGASSVYGERTETMWGHPHPIAAERVVAIEDGESIDLGDRRLQAIETPGHANHHHAWLDEETGELFAGDAVGMQVDEYELWRPATPPAAFDLVQALASIEKMRALRPARIWLGHFGAASVGGATTATEQVLDAGALLLREWVAAITEARERIGDTEKVIAAMRRWLHRREIDWPEAARARLNATNDPALDVRGVIAWLESRARKSQTTSATG